MVAVSNEKTLGELEQLLADTIESLDGAASILAELSEEFGFAPEARMRLHAVCDVLTVCHSRLDKGATLIDESYML